MSARAIDCDSHSARRAAAAPNALRVAVLHAADDSNRTLSYQISFPEALKRHPLFRATLINVLDRRQWAGFQAWRALRLDRADAIVLLHSVFSNACKLGGRLRDLVASTRAPKVLFLGNEYKLMPEKIDFARRIGVSVLVTQFSAPAAIAHYREHLGCPVIHVPNAAVDPTLFRPGPALKDRPIDVGYRAHDAPWYLGHNERRQMADSFAGAAARHGLTIDISMNSADRMAPPAWAKFLARCKAQIGTEAGGDYFELTDEIRKAVNAYLNENPDADFGAVHERFFASYSNPMPGRIISSRNAEAAATKTVQVLLEGAYGGYLEADRHYIPVRKDFSNVDEALQKLADAGFCDSLTKAAYKRVMDALTFDRVLARFRRQLGQLL